MPAEVIELEPRFDPHSESAEDHYDGTVSRVRGLRLGIRKLQREASELERQFIENDLVARSGARRGQPLGLVGRRRRLQKLTDLQQRLVRARDEETIWLGHLDRMQRALERWATDHFGPAPDAPSTRRREP